MVTWNTPYSAPCHFLELLRLCRKWGKILDNLISKFLRKVRNVSHIILKMVFKEIYSVGRLNYTMGCYLPRDKDQEGSEPPWWNYKEKTNGKQILKKVVKPLDSFRCARGNEESKGDRSILRTIFGLVIGNVEKSLVLGSYSLVKTTSLLFWSFCVDLCLYQSSSVHFWVLDQILHMTMHMSFYAFFATKK